MQAYQFEQRVPASHSFTVQLPADAPTGPAQVIVLFPDAHDTFSQPEQSPFANIADYLAWHDTQPASGRSPEDVDRQIREAREGWGD